ncbi:phage integrase SAM-like domain-containing protein [Domibacillus iocasae]|uniref:Core-binding (CB) domain-containing protein n=1 Tax=Domibacillus iocasae TaxID=1714016 RepID=A0A1E7DQT5_9BACI|nr:phage integrase SAM-like domain-containing protein [Domibacillus iocasae]OES45365.1 hypothetical protein BA724_05010 [Domibacillus iocasae]
MLGEFVSYCIENEVVNVEDISYSHVRQYLSECQERGNKAGTINTKLLRIRAFLNYMVEYEVIKNNPAKRVKRQKEDVKIDVFNDEQILNFYRRIKRVILLIGITPLSLLYLGQKLGVERSLTCNGQTLSSLITVFPSSARIEGKKPFYSKKSYRKNYPLIKLFVSSIGKK